MQQSRSGYHEHQLLDKPQQTPFRLGRHRTRPRRIDIFLHGVKTFKLIGALIGDPRVGLWRKALFFGSLGALLLILLFPDALNEFVLSTILPLVGTVLGIPIDAGIDWLGFALVVVTLLRFFPPHLVAEHYRQIF
jgi:hypothetical protein